MNTDHRADAPARLPTIMVVDDDRLVLLTLAHGLRVAGFEVLEADNGDDAILLARQRRPALALLDIRMQGLSGFDVAQHLKDYARIPFLFISAFADDDIRRQAQALGALACLSKPVNMNDLVERIHQALAVSPGGAANAAVGLEAPNTAIAELVTMAVGLLMQRDRLDRHAARRRLQEAAQAHGGELVQAARALLSAHEAALMNAVTSPLAPPAGSAGRGSGA